ncbi:YugN-like family protein [Paenibacillus sp. TRM 82003]|nr:YugN-like family protein [Paenibacillus sp. TRM 82003]
MIALESKLTNMELDYAELKEVLEGNRFTLGGNWEYESGSFDCRLDGEKQTVWLRIPFEVVHGRLDPEAPQPGTRVVIGTPYVLRHLYQEGDDPTADVYLFGAIINQFQKPEDPDAKVPSSFVQAAKDTLRDVEALFR